MRVFFADVHGMLSLIGKLFAIPSMKGYNDRVVLDRDGTSADQYPGTEAQILWLPHRTADSQTLRLAQMPPTR
ncbi:hypothetical protein AA042_19020 [Pseudomonas lundensis]|uniref:hypothetical protein n=2 Tax=Pseudomonas lundensis TaxID=86185 RepID=UPI000699523F|nr:hypothetical protein AA042_19020 [Pseudomonas lundensis]